MTRATPYNRDEALNAAMSLFWDKGYHATSLKDLEAALHMKPGSIYAAFTSKEGLFLEALARYFEMSRAGLQAQLSAAASPLDGVAAHLRSYAALPDGAPSAQACMLVKTLVDTRSTDPVIAERSRKYMQDIRDDLAGAFERAIALGELPADADPQRLARRLQAAITALRIEMHQGTDREALSALADDLAGEFERLRQGPA